VACADPLNTFDSRADLAASSCFRKSASAGFAERGPRREVRSATSNLQKQAPGAIQKAWLAGNIPSRGQVADRDIPTMEPAIRGAINEARSAIFLQLAAFAAPIPLTSCRRSVAVFRSVESVARDGPKRVLGLLFRGFVAREVTAAPAPYTGAVSPGLSRGDKARRVRSGTLPSHSKNSLALDRQPDARRSASPRSPCCRVNTTVPGNRTSDAVRGVPAPE
jgi:hypothetical protein